MGVHANRREWEKRQEAMGYHPHHEVTKEALGALAGVAVRFLANLVSVD